MGEINYFPLGIAKGDAFCNRVRERKQLTANVHKGQHSIVISPRRYGKSSLVLYSLDEAKVLYERVDFFVAVNAETIAEQVLKGVKNLIDKVSSVPEQAVGFIRNYIKHLQSKWIVGTDGIHIELVPGKENDAVSVIAESLQMLENILRKKKLTAVFFIDEFQEVGVLANSKGIEGAIRNVAQECKNLCFIFSGSNRHILANMFDDRSRPLYMLCDRIGIDRIHEQDYVVYLNKVAQKTWKKNLDQSVLDEILHLTERHPYYMNVLCDKIWGHCRDKWPTASIVTRLWKDYILQEESRVAKDISGLNTSQKKLLIAVSQGISSGLSSKAILQSFDLSTAAVIKALIFLEEEDYLYRSKSGEYSVVDPLIKSSLVLFYQHG